MDTPPEPKNLPDGFKSKDFAREKSLPNQLNINGFSQYTRTSIAGFSLHKQEKNVAG